MCQVREHCFGVDSKQLSNITQSTVDTAASGKVILHGPYYGIAIWPACQHNDQLCAQQVRSFSHSPPHPLPCPACFLLPQTVRATGQTLSMLSGL
jgi:hypothetical protein